MAEADPGVLVRKSWAEKVDASVNAGDSQRAAKNAETSPHPSIFYDVRPARLQSNWTRNAAGLWSATACFIVGDGGRVDTSFVFPVYAPTAVVQPEGEAFSWRFFVVWRGRWETLQQYIKPGTKYAAGRGIEILRYDESTGAVLIDNAGIRGAKVATDDSYTDQNGLLYFNPRHFSWTASSIDIVGKREIRLNTTLVKVVTDVADGTPSYSWLEVIGG